MIAETDTEPILKMAFSAAHPADCAPNISPGTGAATLRGKIWDLKNYSVSTNNNTKLNLYSARRGIQSAWGMISEASDLLRLHRLKPLKH